MPATSVSGNAKSTCSTFPSPERVFPRRKPNPTSFNNPGSLFGIIEGSKPDGHFERENLLKTVAGAMAGQIDGSVLYHSLLGLES